MKPAKILPASILVDVRAELAAQIDHLSGGSDNFAAAIEGAFQAVLDHLGMMGFWLVASLDDGVVCGWDIGCPNGAKVSITNSNNEFVSGDGEALIEGAWQAFLTARTATNASVRRASKAA